MIETARLILRRWRPEDREPYAAMMSDPEVGRWLGGPFDRQMCDARIDRSEAAFDAHGWGRFALERRSDGRLVGYCGLMLTREDLPLPRALEIGWGLARDAWGQGYAAEAARAVVEDGFTRLDQAEILAFTSATNVRSRAVMVRLGMTRAPQLDFDHPGVAEGDPMRRSVVFVARP